MLKNLKKSLTQVNDKIYNCMYVCMYVCTRLTPKIKCYGEEVWLFNCTSFEKGGNGLINHCSFSFGGALC